MKKTYLLAFAVIAYSVSAQLPTLSSRTNTYAHLVGATQLFKDSIWDDPADDYDTKVSGFKMPFKWKFGWYSVDTVVAGDGYISFNNMDTSVSIGILADLVDRGFGSSKSKSPISYLSTGTTPNRIVKIQFRNFGFLGQENVSVPLTDSGNAQIWLYETGNKYELHFGVSSVKDSTNSLDGSDGLTIAYFRANQGSFFDGRVVDGTFAAPKWASLLSGNMIMGMPANGSVFVMQFGAKTSSIEYANDVAKNTYIYNHILYTQQNAKSASLLDLTGRKILNLNIQNGKSDLTNVANGIYLMQIEGQVIKVILD